MLGTVVLCRTMIQGPLKSFSLPFSAISSNPSSFLCDCLLTHRICLYQRHRTTIDVWKIIKLKQIKDHTFSPSYYTFSLFCPPFRSLCTFKFATSFLPQLLLQVYFAPFGTWCKPRSKLSLVLPAALFSHAFQIN